MAGKIVADTLEHSTAGSVTTDYVVNGSAKAFVKFDGNDATPSADKSLNHSSITDNGTGDYSVTVSSAFSDANYGILLTGGRSGTGGNVGGEMTVDNVSPTTTVQRMNSFRNTNTAGDDANDVPNITCMCIGDLA